MRGDAVKPSREAILQAIEESLDVGHLPYQWANWAAIKLGKQPTAYVGDVMRMSHVLDFYDACQLELEQEDVL